MKTSVLGRVHEKQQPASLMGLIWFYKTLEATWKKVVLKNSRNYQNLANLSKPDFITGVFLSILRNF